jgi:hypothetical protein
MKKRWVVYRRVKKNKFKNEEGSNWKAYKYFLSKGEAYRFKEKSDRNIKNKKYSFYVKIANGKRGIK